MKLMAPDYFGEFKCIAGKCRHSCCVGWEIDIDEAAMERYSRTVGPLGQRLAEQIDRTGECPHFRLGEDERCPFLNGDNLCDIIIGLGEEGLCEICADHPRFRNYLSDRTEIGLGLCCEAAGRLILERTEAPALTVLEDDGEAEALWEEEEEILAIRDALMAIARDRTRTVDDRAAEMLAFCEADLPQRSPTQWAEIYGALEMLDPAWGERLKDMAACPGEDADLSIWEIPFEQLLVYFIYRHILPAAEDGNLAGRAVFIALSMYVIRRMCASHARKNGGLEMDDLVEIARMYSSEIEYSDENLEALMNLEQD